jgi:hypothetical protein
MVTTTKKSLHLRKAVLDLSLLSQTFRDAISITRRLQMRYIWIDSLCIILEVLLHTKHLHRVSYSCSQDAWDSHSSTSALFDSRMLVHSSCARMWTGSRAKYCSSPASCGPKSLARTCSLPTPWYLMNRTLLKRELRVLVLAV